MAKTEKQDSIYRRRLERHHDELRWLYMELYNNGSMFAELCDNLSRFYGERDGELKKRDRLREEYPHWYRQNAKHVILPIPVRIFFTGIGRMTCLA